MEKIFHHMSRFGLLYSTLMVRKQILEFKIKIQKIFNSIIILWFSSFFWFIGFVMIFGSVFFYFSELLKYSIASLITASISLGLGLVISLFGLYCFNTKDL